MNRRKRLHKNPSGKLKSVFLRGRKWFDPNGNTYHSVQIKVNGSEVGYVPFEYGYGEQWVYTGVKALMELGYIPKKKDFIAWKVLDALSEKGVHVDYYAHDVKRKKDL